MLYFYSKNGHNSVETDRTGKKFTLALKTTYKKVFLKYQVNSRFTSLCLASENAIFGGGKKKKKVGKPIGDPGGTCNYIVILHILTNMQLRCTFYNNFFKAGMYCYAKF